MHCQIDLLNRTGVTVWEDANHHMQHTSELRMDMLVDTSEQQALFVLQHYIFIKGHLSSVPMYLFVYPESIRSIEFDGRTRPPTLGMEERSNDYIRLRFFLSKPLTVVFAKDRPLQPKNKSIGRLDVFKALASVNTFDFYLNWLNLVPEMRSQLALLPSIFSPTSAGDRPKTDKHRGSLSRLYAGAGGQVLDLGVTFAEPDAGPSDNQSEQLLQHTTEWVAPAYTKDGSVQSPAQVITPPDRKRRRTSESPSPSAVDKRILTALAQLQSRVQHLEKLLADSTRGDDHTPCRYDSEEQEHIIGHLGDKIDNDMLDVRFELEDKLLDETQQLVLEKAEEQQSQLWNEMQEGLMDAMRREIKEELEAELKAKLRRELAAEVKAELFKDMAQAMMRAACGDAGGKSGTGSSQSTESTDSTH